MRHQSRYLFPAAYLLVSFLAATAQVDGPDPREIPVPRIKTPLGTLPGVKDLPVRKDLPDVLMMNDGTKVTNRKQWEKRREEMKRILSYYAIGEMPPAPGNVKGKELKSESVLDGAVRYRLVHLTFGPGEQLGLDIGIFTPVKGGPFPTIILQGGTPPGGTVLPRLPQGQNQGKGQDVLMLVGPTPIASTPSSGSVATAQAVAGQHTDVFRRGYALVVFNANDCAEDTTLRNADGELGVPEYALFPGLSRLRLGHSGGLGMGRVESGGLSRDRSGDRQDED